MDYEPSEIQRLILWRLIANGGEDWQKDVKPELKKETRDPLVRAGLLEVERKRNPHTKGTGNFVRVTDAGWAWAKENMDAQLSPRSTAGGDVLRRLLERLGMFLQRSGMDLTDVICPRGELPAPSTADTASAGASAPSAASSGKFTTRAEVPPPPAPLSEPPADVTATRVEDQAVPVADLADRVADACMKLSHGQANTRVRLADLRQRISDVPRQHLDQTLLSMSREGKLALYRLDDPREIGPEDHQAALHTASGEPRHIVYFG